MSKNTDLREYSGWLKVELNFEQREKVQGLATGAGLDIDIADSYLEFEYAGRDSNRFVVAFLAAVAKVVGDADGEVRCEADVGDEDPVFEFYRIQGGALRLQRGRIVRQPEEAIPGQSPQ